MEARTYIVVASPRIGGSEKRFFDIYCSLVETDPAVHLVAPSSLLDALDVEDAPPSARRNVIALSMPRWSIPRFLLALYPVIRTAPRGSLFHYPLNPVFFLHAFRGHQLSMSLCDCVHTPHFDPGNKSVLLQLSRLEDLKGVVEYLDLLPPLWARLKGSGMSAELRFLICGEGSLASLVTERVEHLRETGLPVSFLGLVDSREILGRARVAFSLQRHTSFPSRVVGEALMCGCTVLVRNTGDSAAFGPMVGISCLHPDLSVAPIGDRLTEILGLTDDEYDRRADAIRADALTRCSSPAYIEYFRSFLSNDARAVDGAAPLESTLR